MRVNVKGPDVPWTGPVLAVALLWIAGLAGASSDLRLVEATQNQDTTAVATLLKQQVDVNTPQPDGATALHWAVHWDDLETADLLVGAGADVNAANDYGATPLSLACTNGSAAMIETLLKAGANANAALPSGETALMTAARTGNVDAVKALLARGAHVNAKETAKGQTALMWAASEQHREVARALIAHGADVQARSHSGFTPLLFAARVGNVGVARLLLDHGADVNETDSEGHSVLLAATVRGHVPLAQFLLEQGADPNADGAGYTPLHWAAGESESTVAHDYQNAPGEWSAFSGIPTRKGKVELIKALLAHGADVNARLKKDMPRYGFTQFPRNYLIGGTPFYLAVQVGDVQVMRLLLANGVDPAIPADDNTTALVVAAGLTQQDSETRVPESAHLEAVKLLIDLGIDINAANDGGFNALHAAALAGFDTVVQFLVDNGIKLNEKTKTTTRNAGARVPGQTALGIAEGSNFTGFFLARPSTAALLRKFGAVSEGAMTLEVFMAQQQERLEQLEKERLEKNEKDKP